MLSIITGKQRSGKSYYCVTLIIDELRKTKRHIYTNFPLNPDRLASCACGGRSRSPNLYNSYLQRIHTFKNFGGRSRRDLISFRKENPDYIKLHHSLMRDKGKPLILPYSKIQQFWNLTLPNSLIMLDEIYEIFGALDQQSKGKELRKEMLSYTRQHGHYKDDLFLISHKLQDIDRIIRNGAQLIYKVSNSKYENFIEHRLFRGLRTPFQCFKILSFDSEKSDVLDCFRILPKKEVFKCYNSFSGSDFLHKEQSSDDEVSDDSRIDHKANWLRFFRQGVPYIFFIGASVFIFFWTIYFMINNFTKTTSPGLSDQVQNSDYQGGGDGVDNVPSPPPDPIVVFHMIDRLIFSDGTSIKKGDFINDWEIQKVDRDFVYARRGDVFKRFRIPRSFGIESKADGASSSSGSGGSSSSGSASSGSSRGFGVDSIKSTVTNGARRISR